VLAGSRLALRLDGEFARFRSRVGATQAKAGSLGYRVIADGKVLFERSGAGAVDVDVAVEGVKTLELQVTQGGPARATQVAWAGAELVR
jgi:hypothetical protein